MNTDVRNTQNWTYRKLVGIISIINAFNSGIRGRYELAKHLNVTEEFLEEALNYYKEKYGTYCEIDNYLIYFDPSLLVLKVF